MQLRFQIVACEHTVVCDLISGGMDQNGSNQYLYSVVFPFKQHCGSTTAVTSNDPCTVGHSSKDSPSSCEYVCVCYCVHVLFVCICLSRSTVGTSSSQGPVEGPGAGVDNTDNQDQLLNQ